MKRKRGGTKRKGRQDYQLQSPLRVKEKREWKMKIKVLYHEWSRGEGVGWGGEKKGGIFQTRS